MTDVDVLFAVAPFITAGLGWLWLGVREMWTTLAASLVAMIGMIIIVGGALTDGHLFGDILAIGMAVMILIFSPAPRDADVPGDYMSALLGPFLVWPFASPLDVTTIGLFKLFLFGITQFGLGLILLTIGG